MTARARKTDPSTSHQAAESVHDLRESQEEVLALFREYGPMPDQVMMARAREAGITQSVSGMRTRRSELVGLGLLRDSGKKHTLKNGRKAIVWELVPEGGKKEKTPGKKLKDNTVIRVPGKDRKKRQIGKVFGDTFISFQREEEEHLFRGGSETADEAMKSGTGAWGLDLAAMTTLYEDHGVRFVEVPTPRARYRTRMETLLGPKGYVVEFAGHRPQVMLPLDYWTQVRGGEASRLVPVTKFGETRLVPLRVVQDAKPVEDDRDEWDEVLWVERVGEDDYALLSPQLRPKRVLVVRAEEWREAPEVKGEDGVQAENTPGSYRTGAREAYRSGRP